MRSRLSIAIAFGLATVLLCLLVLELRTLHKPAKVHQLEFPLLVSSDRESQIAHLLPAGTTMYFDQAYPEGFTRYKVYVNVDRLPLGLTTQKDPTEIVPIDAAAPTGDDLKKLLSSYPLTKSGLEAILKSGKVTREEIKSLLTEYSK
jgi:hypothetical protein